MRIISINLNGVRSAARLGFFDWLSTQNADVICLQETRAQKQQLTDPVFHPQGYHDYYVDAEKRGYSGVALYSRGKPKQVTIGLGREWLDQEARYIRADFDKLSVASVYLPSGTSGEHRQILKYEFLELFLEHLRELKKAKHECVICGDWNIAHKNIDIKNWRSNQKNSGFLPEERAWLDRLFDEEGFVDAFRVINQGPDQYTWWSNRGQAYAKNVGWRIDYQVVTPGLKNKIKAAIIFKDKKFSDHAPLIIDYDAALL